MPEPTATLLASMLRERLERGETASIKVTSDSMAPLLLPDDVIGVAPIVAQALQPGMIITLAHAADRRQFLTHRFVAWAADGSEDYLLCRGDRNAWFDAPQPVEALVGQVIWRRRGGTVLDLREGRGRWLDEHLARWAAREQRWLADLPLAGPAVAAAAVGAANATSRRRSRGWTVRVGRRLLRAYTGALTVALGHGSR